MDRLCGSLGPSKFQPALPRVTNTGFPQVRLGQSRQKGALAPLQICRSPCYKRQQIKQRSKPAHSKAFCFWVGNMQMQGRRWGGVSTPKSLACLSSVPALARSAQHDLRLIPRSQHRLNSGFSASSGLDAADCLRVMAMPGSLRRTSPPQFGRFGTSAASQYMGPTLGISGFSPPTQM